MDEMTTTDTAVLRTLKAREEFVQTSKAAGIEVTEDDLDFLFPLPAQRAARVEVIKAR